MSTVGSCGPKLEDFLGGRGGELAARISGNGAEPDTGAGIYDSDLKTIAAGLLQDFPPYHQESDGGNKEPATAVAPAESKKAVDGFGQRTSIYRGVTRHRWTGRYEAHLWDNSCRREGQSRKGRQGGYDKEEKAARAYDLAALKYWGPTTTTNFPVSSYEKEMEEMKNMTRQEFVASLRRKSSGFSRGASIYRGVTRHHQHGRWQARIGRVAGNKDLYLGTFSTQEEAAEAYDIAAIKFRGLNAVTNFDMSRYDVKSIVASNLPVGGMAGGRASKPADSPSSSVETRSLDGRPQGEGRDIDLPAPAASLLGLALPLSQNQQHHDYWSLLALHNQQIPKADGGYPPPVNVDFSSATVQGHGNFFWSGGIMQQQQQEEEEQTQSQGYSVSYAASVPPGSSRGGDAPGYVGNWVTPIGYPMQPYDQGPKSGMAHFQTPIYGIE
ncbi:unnamed protein product [Spirodela intermedia]|uniref:AP2/ERF domain-containing protein n=1 Tax=Spirodela intermedia TaxID=51605 RepID=A0A7I8JKL4_SPIIN|nr:unnamed protein product [Spirodela intermedia]CAA6670325.1 unnamed protein product [Spirodela intermedia]